MLRFALLAWLVLSSVLGGGVAPVLAVGPVELIERVREQEAKLLAIRITGGEVTGEWSERFEGAWSEDLPYVSGDILIDGTKGGLFLAKLRNRTSVWLAGDADAIDEQCEIAFDGERYWKVDHSAEHLRFTGPTRVLMEVPGVGAIRSGPTNRGVRSMTPIRRAMAAAEPQPWRADETISMLDHAKNTLLFYGEGSQQDGRVSHILERAHDSRNLTVQMEDVNGQRAVVARINGGPTFVFDPERGHALLRWFQGDLTTHSRVEGEVLEFVDILPGVFYPSKSRYVRPEFLDGKPRGFVRLTSVSTAVSHEETTSKHDFTPVLPEGYLVEDQVAGEVYRVGMPPIERNVQLEPGVREGRELTERSTSSGMPALAVIGAGVVGLVVVIVVGQWMRKRAVPSGGE